MVRQRSLVFCRAVASGSMWGDHFQCNDFCLHVSIDFIHIPLTFPDTYPSEQPRDTNSKLMEICISGTKLPIQPRVTVGLWGKIIMGKGQPLPDVSSLTRLWKKK